jgi:hypothetical protein
MRNFSFPVVEFHYWDCGGDDDKDDDDDNDDTKAVMWKYLTHNYYSNSLREQNVETWIWKHSVHAHTHTHICIYIHTHIYMYMYVYIYIYRERERCWQKDKHIQFKKKREKQLLDWCHLNREESCGEKAEKELKFETFNVYIKLFQIWTAASMYWCNRKEAAIKCVALYLDVILSLYRRQLYFKPSAFF